MINKIAFTGKTISADIFEKPVQSLKNTAEKYFCDSTIIEDTEQFTSKFSRFDSPYELVNIAENKPMQKFNEISDGFHFNYFG